MRANNTMNLTSGSCALALDRASFPPSGSGVFPGNLPAAQSNENMHGEERSSARADVLRVVARYRSTEYDVGSVAGKWAIHETRLGVEIDIEEASVQEVVDAIVLAELRRRIYAKPAQRRDVTPTPDVRHLDDAEPLFCPWPRIVLRCVAPRPDVTPVVRVRPSRPSSGGDSGIRAWRGTVGWCLKPLPPVCVDALFRGADTAAERVPVRNHLQTARSIYERASSGGRKARRLAAVAAEEVHRLEIEDRRLCQELDQIVAGDAHRAGLIGLEREIYRFPDRPAVVFGGLL